MANQLRVAVVGYGSGGQATALLLSRDGHRVEVFERVAQPGPVGAGFLLQPVGLRVLWSWICSMPHWRMACGSAACSARPPRGAR